MCPASFPMVRPNSAVGSIEKWANCSATKPSTSVAVEVERRGLSSRACWRVVLEAEGVLIGVTIPKMNPDRQREKRVLLGIDGVNTQSKGRGGAGASRYRHRSAALAS